MLRPESEPPPGKEIKGFLLIPIRKAVCDKLAGRAAGRVWMRRLHILVLGLCGAPEAGVRLWGGKPQSQVLGRVSCMPVLGPPLSGTYYVLDAQLGADTIIKAESMIPSGSRRSNGSQQWERQTKQMNEWLGMIVSVGRCRGEGEQAGSRQW